MPRDIDLEAELRREAMDRLIAASTGGVSGSQATPARGAPAKSAQGRAPGPDGSVAA